MQSNKKAPSVPKIKIKTGLPLYFQLFIYLKFSLFAAYF